MPQDYYLKLIDTLDKPFDLEFRIYHDPSSLSTSTAQCMTDRYNFLEFAKSNKANDSSIRIYHDSSFYHGFSFRPRIHFYNYLSFAWLTIA